MSDTVAITIGGEAFSLGPLSFAALKRAWPAIKALPDKPDLVGQAEAVVEIVAAALGNVRPELTPEAIETRLIGREFVDLVGAVPKLLAISGLVPTEEAGR
jgi:hypothetical protein